MWHFCHTRTAASAVRSETPGRRSCGCCPSHRSADTRSGLFVSRIESAHTGDVTPEVRYARNGDVSLAYQIVGDGPFDLLFVPGFASNLIWNWELPDYARFLRRLSSFCRLIVIDRRGCGLSDRLSPHDLPPLEILADDLSVVLDAVGSEHASLFGAEDGAMTCALFAATHPERVDRLIIYTLDPMGDQPWDEFEDRVDRARFFDDYLTRMNDGWGTRAFARLDPLGGLITGAPSLMDDEATLAWYTAWQQLAASPSGAVALHRVYFETDAQPILAAVRVPTLLVHRVGDQLEPIEESRFIAGLIPGARLVELAGDEHLWFVGDTDPIVDAVQEFVTGEPPARHLDRVLVTVLFTDIVGSTAKAAEVGDQRWQVLLNAHNDRVRKQLASHRGTELDTTGDGFLATFDGPARAVHCARAICDAVRDLGIEIRAGCHTGEVELADDNVRGIAVHIGARIAALGGPSEVLVSSTVKDLVAGSGLVFEDRGEHDLKGVPDRWRVYRVVN
jgi:class 3 adenylate cyclase